MTVHKRVMQNMIVKNGHLVLEGDETTEELRTALYNLRRHTYANCRRPYLGMPIESLLPDISVLAVRSTRSKSAKTVNVDMSGEKV